jgi:RNA polymerase sigma-70 factor (ECF subfamily)
MHEEPTTTVIQRYLDALPDGAAADLIIRDLLEQAVGRLRLACASFLHKNYPRLTRPPANLETDELLGGVVARLLTALRTIRPATVRQFFALACLHMRWQLNDLARRLDEQPAALSLPEAGVAGPPVSTGSGLTPAGRRMLEAIESLPDDEREVFDVVGIQGLTQAELAGLVGVSEKTVKRRLNRARLLLAEQLADLRPAMSSKPTPPAGDSVKQSHKPFAWLWTLQTRFKIHKPNHTNSSASRQRSWPFAAGWIPPRGKHASGRSWTFSSSVFISIGTKIGLTHFLPNHSRGCGCVSTETGWCGWQIRS